MKPVRIKLLNIVRDFSKCIRKPGTEFFSLLFSKLHRRTQVTIKEAKVNFTSNKIDNSSCSADEILTSPWEHFQQQNSHRGKKYTWKPVSSPITCSTVCRLVSSTLSCDKAFVCHGPLTAAARLPGSWGIPTNDYTSSEPQVVQNSDGKVQ